MGGGGGGGGASVSEFFQLRIQISNNFFLRWGRGGGRGVSVRGAGRGLV